MGEATLESKNLVCVLCLSVVCSAIGDDGEYMLKLAKALRPTPSGWSVMGSNFCEWNGVNCSSTKRVTSINLTSESLAGTLPPGLNSLSQLNSLYLQNNALTGALPSFANLSMLEHLRLDGNNFTSVPNGCFLGLTSLYALTMANNINLSPWKIPTDLAHSFKLVSLNLKNANLVGSLPDIFDSLVTLKYLNLDYNNLTGGLPKTFAGSGIQKLWFHNPNDGFGFSGSIQVLSSMTHLSLVWLQNNHFTGPIPDLSNCTTLFDLQLQGNQLTGVVPPSLMSLSSLRNVSLDNNALQGPLPSFGKDVIVKVIRGGFNSFCRKDAGPCDSRVTTLLDIAKDFGYPLLLARSWTGNNPCQNWSFIECDDKDKITGLNLGKQNLTGTISPAFASLTDLRNLYLNGNNLVGSIPESLTNLAQLVFLDVSNNNLSGDVPKFSTKVNFNASGNELLHHSRGGNGTPSLSLAWIAGMVIIAVLFVPMLLFFFCSSHAKNWLGKFKRVSDVEKGKGGVQSFEMTIQVLRQATNNFSEDKILGRGGFGVVYKGELNNGSIIAVKRMQSGAMGSKGMNEFQAEIAFLSKVSHRSLVALLGYCIHRKERLLVYEYMPQGTLTQHLFYWRKDGFAPLTWKQRVTIAMDVAQGVEYLHSLTHQIFIHRDLKPSNILLGVDMRAKVSDFGLVKNTPDGKDSVETRVAGTVGYLAPEYAATGKVTTKADVYAFGVVLMQLITGRKAVDRTLPEEMSHLVSWLREIINSNMENITVAIDQNLNPDEEIMESLYKVAELAGHCTAPEPHQRPDMRHAVSELGPLVEQWNPTCTHEEGGGGGGYDMIKEGTMSFSENQLGR